MRPAEMLKIRINVSCKSLRTSQSVAAYQFVIWQGIGFANMYWNVLYASEAARSSIYNHCLQNKVLQEVHVASSTAKLSRQIKKLSKIVNLYSDKW